MAGFSPTFANKLIYVFRINDSKVHEGLLKIGEATIHTSKNPDELKPNCKELNEAAKNRIKEYTQTASIEPELIYTEIAVRTKSSNGKSENKAFGDKDVHSVLERSGINRHDFKMENQGREWFKTDLETVKRAIKAVKECRSSLGASEISNDRSPIIFRPEQKDAIKATIANFKKSDHMLWNAKMRFGKTLTALEVAKEMGFKKTIILTHRPVVSDGWFEDFNKIFYEPHYVFGSKTKGEKIESLKDAEDSFVYFASIQDLRGSSTVGGKFDKNDSVFSMDWDFIIIDEAHEGTQTELGKKVVEELINRSTTKQPKLLELSGTPFNIIEHYKPDEIYTWDYIMEQRAKAEWPKNHYGDSNPYEELPKLEIFTYNLDKTIPGYIDAEDSAFNFREFFRTWTGNIGKDYKRVPKGAKIGDFVHQNDVKSFLNLLTKEDDKSNYPFSTGEARSFYRHTLWMVPGVKEAKALSEMMRRHEVFGSGAFKIVNVAGDGDEEENSNDALKKVRDAIGDNPDDHYSITISCGRLTTGVTVPEWTAVFMLSGTFSTSASSYLQTIFRVQSPANISGRIKERCAVFDFAPDRTLKMVAEAGSLSTKVGRTNDTERVRMNDLLNYCPVVAIDGSNMEPYNVDKLLQQLKKAYVNRVVKSGFDDNHIYNDKLSMLCDEDNEILTKLKKIVGVSKQTEKMRDISINDQGFTKEEYAELERIQKKPIVERTPEELAFIKKRNEKRKLRRTAISILRGISIRIPLLIYGADLKEDEDITADNLVEKIDSSSWEEFMPKGVTKEYYKEISKFYEKDIFVAAGKQIRAMARSADDLPPLERVKKIAMQFSMFKNPDKETVLTPWRVVNMHMSDTLGGWCFYNEDFTDTIEEPRFVDCGDVTKDTLLNTNAKILEINSKTGLYPLYVTYSIFRKRLDEIPEDERTFVKQNELWMKTVEENVFIICKTPMAKAITKRTLLGYRDGRINAHAFDDLINKLKEKPQQFKNKVLRGSFWNREEDIMKFNAVVGNPPYQVVNQGDGNGADPIYHYFIDMGADVSNISTFIHPARFLFNAGKTPREWNEKMLTSNHFEVVDYWINSTDVFSNVDIKGGIAVTLYNKNSSHAPIGFFSAYGELKSIVEKVTKKDFNSFSILIYPRDPYRLTDELYQENPTMENRQSKGHKYDCGSNLFEIFPELCTEEKPNDSEEYAQLYGRISINRAYRWIKRKYLKAPDNLDFYKVFIPKANGSGAIGEVLSTPVVGQPVVGHTATFLSIGKFEKQETAEAVLKYIKTKFARAMLGVLKVTQNNTKETWAYVPLQDFTEKSDIDWTAPIPDIDKQLYKKYNLTDDEIAFIETMIKPME